MTEPLTPLQGALDLALRDFYVFPIPAGTKAPPFVQDWENVASATTGQINKWAAEYPNCNWGCAPARSGHVVFDVDRKKGKDGLAELEALAAAHGFEIPDTLIVATPNGGFHFYFRGTAQSSAGRIAPGVDVRARGGYVLAPGSVIDGKAYAITNDLEAWDDIPEPPAKLLKLAEGEKREAAKAASDVAFDTPIAIGRVTRLLNDYIARDHVAIEGQGGDERTYAVCAEVLNLGLSPDKAFGVLQPWNSACVPPWGAEDLRTKIENARNYAQNSDGAWAVPSVRDRIPADALSKLIAESDAPAVPPGEPTSFSAVLTRTVPPVQEVVAGLVERQTVTFLSAPGGSHKSRLAVQWGLSIDAGVPIFGRAVERAAFHYLSYEDHADEVARRAQAIARRLSLAADTDGQFWDLSGKDAPLAIVRESGECETRPLWDKLRSHLTADAGHKFVVIDSTYNALRFEGAAKINEGAVMAGIGLLQRLCDECDCTLLVLWHPSQAGQERGDASGWSVAWHNAPRARLSLAPVKDTEDAFDLKVEKRNHGRKGKPITLYWSDGVLLPRGDTDAAEQGARLADACVRVAEAAAEQGYPIQAQKKLNKWMVDEIEAAAGYRPTERVVKEALSLAMRDGKLRYLKGTNRRMAGYYPKDQRRAENLAIQAKKQGAPNV